MTQLRKKYFVRFSTAADFDNISAFYDDNEHDNVYKRKEELMRAMTNKGAVALVEDEAGKIVAASITYPHQKDGGEGTGPVEWQEIGTTRSVLKGYQIADAMVPLQILRAFLVEPPESTFVMRTMTTQVQGLARAIGWRPLDGGPAQRLLTAMKETISEDSSKLAGTNWFMLGVEAMPVLAAWLKKFSDNPVLVNRKTGEEIEVDFSRSTFFTLFKPEIESLAGKTIGNVDVPDQSQNLRQKRNNWMIDFFR